MKSMKMPKSPKDSADHQIGASLKFAHCPTHADELDHLVLQHTCAACGEMGSFIAGDQGPQRSVGPVVYYRSALRCSCGFTNYMNVVVNDLKIKGLGSRPSSGEALRQAEEAGLLPIPHAEELLMNSAAASHRGDWEEADRLIAKCIKNYPNNPAAWYNKGVSLVKHKEDEKAIEAFTKAAELSDEFVSAWLRLGDIHYRLGELKQAIECLDHFLEYHPDHGEALKLRNLCMNPSTIDCST